MILQNEPKYRHTVKILSDQYYTTKYLMSYLLSKYFILWAFLIRQKKQSRLRSIVCVGNQLNSYVFFTVQNNLLSKFRVIFILDSHIICTPHSAFG